MNLTNERQLIFMKEFNGKQSYTVSVSTTNTDGSKDYMNINVQFKGETYIPDRSYIKINHGFLTCYKAKDGTMKPKIVVMQYELLESPKQEEKPTDDPYAEFGNNIKAKDIPDLPF